jgi:hypothetical protein
MKRVLFVRAYNKRCWPIINVDGGVAWPRRSVRARRRSHPLIFFVYVVYLVIYVLYLVIYVVYLVIYVLYLVIYEYMWMGGLAGHGAPSAPGQGPAPYFSSYTVYTW